MNFCTIDVLVTTTETFQKGLTIWSFRFIVKSLIQKYLMISLQHLFIIDSKY